MQKFGQTWWGKAWLNALADIDYSNRLPRGRAYARSGAITSIDIPGNQITARVKGHQRYPYKITIKVPPFTESQKNIFTEEITGNTLLLTELLNRHLPPELDRLARSHGMKLFPDAWDDLDMRCSCPDWAVPCKHLAAVIFMIANEIDKNPFLIFQLHDYDLIRALEQKQISVKRTGSQNILHLNEIITAEPIPHLENAENRQPVDYTQIINIQDKIFQLLPPRPLFYEKDFKPILRKVYKEMAGIASGRSFTASEKADAIDPAKISAITVKVDSHYTHNHVEIISGKTTSKTDLSDLIQLLDRIQLKDLDILYAQVLGFYELLLFTLHCLVNSAFIPQMIAISDDLFRIRWIPARLDEQVKCTFDKVIRLTAYPLLQIVHDGRGRDMFQSPEEQALTLFSLLIEELMLESGLYEDLKWRYASSKSTHKILELFFDHSAVRFDEFHEKELPQTIHLWMNKLHLSHREYVPVLHVLAEGDEFHIDMLVENRKSGKEPIPLHQYMTDPDNQQTRYEMLRDLSLLSEYFPQLTKIIQSEGREKLIFHAHDFTGILLNILPVIRMLGISILMPKSLQKLLRPKISIQVETNTKEKNATAFNLNEILRFDWRIAIGDQMLSVGEFRQSVAKASGLIKIRDQYVLIDQDEIEKLLKRIEEPRNLSPAELLRSALTENYEDAAIGLSPEVKNLLNEMKAPEQMALPDTLKAELRAYQKNGFEWIAKNARIGFGSLIADDMGLGKTVQVLTALLHFKHQGNLKTKKALIVVPTTLITNWVREMETFTPELTCFIYHGQNRLFEPGDADCVITSYGILRSDLKILQKTKWYAVVIDEAQNIKNPATAQTKAVKKIDAPIRIAMSGTPVENRLSEYWSILDFTNKGYLGSLKRFNESFARPIQLDHDQHKIEQFRKMTAPFILRRMKTDKNIIRDLPDKIENNLYCTLTQNQAALYQSVVSSIMNEIESRQGIQRRGLIFKLMTSLKQICNHPYHFLKDGDQNPDISGKTALFFNVLDTIHETHEKALIFTQYREMGDLLVRFLEDRYNSAPRFLHGGTPRKQRDEMVDAFQNDRHMRTFILSLKAGGTGLNLTAATNVIHYDLWWNPAVENQATDRAYRIGQTGNVMVYRLITQGTFEERIDEMLRNKKWLADTTVASGEKWIGELSDKELQNLVTLS